ncbi:hypothetical protein GCM10009118_27020 [Wandonia haliotis]|uniref:Uncharacterized protein n=2 Tax=Wandonia haliotis TaxID=574963 RepID=A0ABN1MSG9_9FLAO
MTLILDDTKQLEFHTDMGEIIKPIKEELKSLNWILTNQEYTLLDYKEKGVVEKLDHESEIIHFDGQELLEILESRQIQFIWGVFCATKKRILKLDQDQIPYADMNSEIWTSPDKFLLPDSEIEIICFDSSYTIIKFKDKELEERWRIKFTDAKKLKKKNAS